MQMLHTWKVSSKLMCDLLVFISPKLCVFTIGCFIGFLCVPEFPISFGMLNWFSLSVQLYLPPVLNSRPWAQYFNSM